MREWSEKHIQELIRKTGGGGGGSTGEVISFSRFRLYKDNLFFSEDGLKWSHQISGWLYDSKKFEYKALRAYRIFGGKPTNDIHIDTGSVNILVKPRKRGLGLKGREFDMNINLPIQIGLYTRDTTDPSFYINGVIGLHGEFINESDQEYNSSWVCSVPILDLFLNPGGGANNFDPNENWQFYPSSANMVSFGTIKDGVFKPTPVIINSDGR